MDWIHAFVVATFIGVGSNFDNSGVGLAYGSQKLRFPHRINAIVALIGFCTALLGAYAGDVISRFLTEKAAASVSCFVLIAIGVFFWYSAYVHPWLWPTKGKAKIQIPDWKQGILLGLVLSFTNVATGFGATVSKTSTMWMTTISITLWGYIMIWLGNVVGIQTVSRFLGRYSSFIAGFLLILVGIHEVLG